MTRKLLRWAAGKGKRRLKRELEDYQWPPEVRRGRLLGRSRKAGEQTQVFRSLVQINFYPKPRY